ncbi:OTU deubiquitinase with linear linkage specificity a [Salarias fasciatus]|uniref:Essential protein Yae1 N-terminal domain-containing protein n=1 Tax=Salarias fasciatus TaxID=181472 RepID=A0A672GLE3_SALFA|nr:protein YAE1 homolog [Salarias fasciatus]
MSWVKAASFNGEDVFDESGDELSLQSKEWMSNMKKRVKDGYVDGVDAGEEASLQAGFDQGFREGAAQTAAVGRLKGMVSAISCWCQIQHPESPVPAAVTDLLQQVVKHEDQIMDGIKRALENPPPSVSDVSESMEDLEVEPSGCAEGACKESDCCRTAEKMELGSRSTDCSSSVEEDLNHLLQRCVDVVLNLGLPQELIAHIEEIKRL